MIERAKMCGKHFFVPVGVCCYCLTLSFVLSAATRSESVNYTIWCGVIWLSFVGAILENAHPGVVNTLKLWLWLKKHPTAKDFHFSKHHTTKEKHWICTPRIQLYGLHLCENWARKSFNPKSNSFQFFFLHKNWCWSVCLQFSHSNLRISWLTLLRLSGFVVIVRSLLPENNCQIVPKYLNNTSLMFA